MLTKVIGKPVVTLRYNMKAVKEKIRKYYKYNHTIEGYQDLEYLESSGTQYINTGIVPKNTTIVEVKETAVNNGTSNRSGWGSSGSQEAFWWNLVGNSITKCSVSSNWSSIDMGQSDLNTTHILYLKSGLQSMDGVTYGTSTIGSTATSGQTLYLYALHTEYNSGIEYAKTRIHYCKIWDGDTLVRDFVPVKRLSDGVIGLYDKVNNTLYTNNGSGVFSFVEIPYIIESTSSDYDFYKDFYEYNIIKQNNTYKAIKSYEKGQIFLSNFYNGWIQPILTSNNSYGTISSSITTWSDSPAWKLSDGNYSGTKWGGSSDGGIITWQLPESIKMFSCRIYQTNESSYLNRFPSSINIYGSNNGTSWTLIGSASGYSQPASGSYVVVNCSASDFYSYYKWDFGTSYGGSQIAVGELVIIATLN